MSSTLTSSEEWEVAPSQQREAYLPCAEEVDTTQTIRVSKDVRLDNDRESRTHPGEPAWMYPTATALQYFEEYRDGLYRRGDDFNPHDCLGVPGTHKYWVFYQRPAKNYQFVTTPIPPWKTSLLLKIKADKVNLGETLAEYRQTANMFKTLGLAMLRGYRALRRGDISGLSRHTNLDTIASGRLVYQFGIKPLVNTLYDSIQAMMNAPRSPHKKYTDYTVAETEAIMYGYTTTGKQEVNSTCYVEFDADLISSFTLGNPAELAWELTPFSFLVDYFFSIGDYLSSLDALVDVKSWVGCYSIQKTETCLWHDPVSNPNALMGTVVGIRPSTWKKKSYQRFVITNLSPEGPQWKPSLSFGRILNIMALAVVLRPGR